MGVIGIYYIPDPPTPTYTPPGLTTLPPISTFALTNRLYRATSILPSQAPSSPTAPAQPQLLQLLEAPHHSRYIIAVLTTPGASSPSPSSSQTQQQQQSASQSLQPTPTPPTPQQPTATQSQSLQQSPPPPPQHVITTTPDLLHLLKHKLTSQWHERQHLRIEGRVWELNNGEFRVRVGGIMKSGVGQMVKGAVVEVEWVGGEVLVEEVVREVGEGVVGLRGGRWCWGAGEGVEQVGRAWAEVLRFR
ncbi:hypothetical protein EX30DRAFT_366740 [Ascodesmis nigricans]|uniref:Mediator of RNA polymerase II transcription subunit 20 n=1 Tax=Ascodesmis nigricans TaxID=341454 RepID=A0A4S2MRC6_9PEZI|nr:hypothetical protein EX30DRAFT_366740 [Ascodesmis nigricans]